MPEQEDINALIAEVNALASEAVGSTAAATLAPNTVQPAQRVIPGPTSPRRSTASESQAIRPEDLNRVLNLEVPVIVQLAERTMPLSAILNLNSGAIIEFEKPCESPLDLMINNKCIGHGQAVKVAENFGLRLTTIGSIRDRINALRK